MSNKYFTPDIEDIRVGYECEYIHFVYLDFRNNPKGEYVIPETGWTKDIVNDKSFQSALDLLKDKRLRVPYLTKEQIEAEGWEYNINYESVNYYGGDLGFYKEYVDSKTELYCYYNPIMKKLRIEWVCDHSVMGWIFQGECKDINTFRYICKLLNIK